MKKFKYIFLIFFTYSCGFKVIDPSSLQSFYISNITTSGDKRIGYNLKNKLSIKAKDASKKNISLSIDVKKTKEVKEKNSNNEITKYLIKIDLEVKIDHNDNTVNVFTISEQKDYNVSSQYSQTIVNENQSVKLLSEILVNKILKKISSTNLNDL